MEMAARLVYERSGLGPDDIDAACLYDAFTPEVLMQLESFGFCARGEAKDFIAEGVRLIRGTSCNRPVEVEHVHVSSGVGVPTGALILGR